MYKKIFLNLNKKQEFIIIFSLVCFISSFFTVRVLGSYLGEPADVFYFGRLIFIILAMLTTIISLVTFKFFKSFSISLFIGVLFAYYLSTFLSSYNPSIFYINILLPSLTINAFIALVFSVLASKMIVQK